MGKGNSILSEFLYYLHNEVRYTIALKFGTIYLIIKELALF